VAFEALRSTLAPLQRIALSISQQRAAAAVPEPGDPSHIGKELTTSAGATSTAPQPVASNRYFRVPSLTIIFLSASLPLLRKHRSLTCRPANLCPQPTPPQFASTSVAGAPTLTASALLPQQNQHTAFPTPEQPRTSPLPVQLPTNQ